MLESLTGRRAIFKDAESGSPTAASAHCAASAAPPPRHAHAADGAAFSQRLRSRRHMDVGFTYSTLAAGTSFVAGGAVLAALQIWPVQR